MSNKFEHSLADKVRGLDELQQRAERFQQFTRNMNKEMLAQGQQVAQFYNEFLRTSGQMSGQGSGSNLSTETARSFQSAIQRHGSKSQSDVVLMSEAVRRRNAIAAGVSPDNLPPSVVYSKEEIASAHRDAITRNLANAAGTNSSDSVSYSGVSPSAEKNRRRAMIEAAESRKSAQAALKDRLMSKYGGSDLLNPLASTALLSHTDRRLAAEMAATGGPTHLRYDITDLPGAAAQGQSFQASRATLTNRIESLRSSTGGLGSDTNKTIANALDNVVRRMDASNARFSEAQANFTRLSASGVSENSREYRVALDELRKSIEDLTETNKDLSRATKAADQAAGGGGPTGGGSFLGRVGGWMSRNRDAIGAVAGAAAGLGFGYMRTGLAMDSAIVGAERRGQEARGGLMERLASREFESNDMTNPMNILRYRANILYGQDYKYIGTRPERLMAASAEEVSDSLNVSRQQRNLGIGSAIFSTALGAAKIAGGVALGKVGLAATPFTMGASGVAGIGAGIALGASGVNDIAGAWSNTATTVANNRYGQLSGGLENTILGRMWRGKSEADRRGGLLSEAAKAESRLEMLNYADRLQEAEIKEKHSRDIPVLTEMQKLADMQQQGAIMVGEYAIRRGNLLDSVYGRSVPPEKAAMLESMDRDSGSLAYSPSAQRGVSNMMAERKRLVERKNLLSQPVWGRDPNGRSKRAEIQDIDRRLGMLSLPTGGDSGQLQAAAESFDSLYHPLGGQGYVTSGFGNRIHPITGKNQFHRGIDLGTGGRNLPIYSMGGGTVVGAGYNDISGNFLRIRHKDGSTAAYSHLRDKPEQKIGQEIGWAEKIGLVGTTGRSSGVHLDVSLKSKSGQYLDLSKYLALQDRQGRPFRPEMVGPPSSAAPVSAKASLDTVFSRLEMAPHEFMQSANMVTNVLGNSTGTAGGGIRASIDTTERMVALGRSGLGDFQSMLGNVAAINRTSGGQDNIARLEQVLGSAVAAGFDKSRTAQMFVQTTNDISRSMNVTNVGFTGQILGQSARLMSTTGLADERSLSAAAAGMGTYAQFTAQRGGLVGAFKSASMFAAGATLGGGAGILSGLSSMEAASMLAELENNSTPITNPKLNRLITMQGREGAANQIRAIRSGSNMATRSVMNMMGGKFDSVLSAMQDAKSRGDDKQFNALQQNFLARANDVGETMGLGGNAGEAWAIQEMADRKIISQVDASGMLQQKINSGMNAFADPAKQRLRSYLDGITKDFVGSTRGVRGKQYDEYIAAGGTPLSVSMNYEKFAGRPITPQALEDARKNNKELFDAMTGTLDNTSSLDLVRGASLANAQLQGDSQKVYLTNARELATEIAELQKFGTSTKPSKQNLNSSTGN